MSDPVPTPYAGARPAVPPAVPPMPPGYTRPTTASAWAAPGVGAHAGAQGARTLGIVGIVFAVFLAPAGLVVSLVTLAQTRRGQPGRELAIIGIVLSVVMMVAMVVFCLVAWELMEDLARAMFGGANG